MGMDGRRFEDRSQITRESDTKETSKKENT